MFRPLLAATLLLGAALPFAPAEAQSGNCDGRITIRYMSRTRVPGNLGGGTSFSVRFENLTATQQRFLVTYTGDALSRVNRELTIPGRQAASQWIATVRDSSITDEQFKSRVMLTCY